MASVTRFGYVNTVLTGQISTGSQALPISNIQNQLGSSAAAWQTASGVITSAAGAWIRGASLTSTNRIDCFGAFRTNLTGSAYIRCRVFSDAWATAIYDSGTVPANVQSGIFQTIILTTGSPIASYWQVDFDDPGNIDGFINIPLLYVGPLLQPIIGLGPQTIEQYAANNVLTQTRYGAQYVNAYYAVRQYTAAMAGIYDVELASFETLEMTARDGTNVLVIPDVTSPWVNRQTVFGMCTSSGFGYNMAHRDARSWVGTFVERL